MRKTTDLTAEALAGYAGHPNPHLATSASWYAHELGQHLGHLQYGTPHLVSMGRGDSINSNGMRFKFRQPVAGGPLVFSRVE